MKWNKLAVAVLAASMVAATVPAHAAIDVAAVVTEIGGTVAPIGLIGAASLLVAVAIKAYKWVRRAL